MALITGPGGARTGRRAVGATSAPPRNDTGDAPTEARSTGPDLARAMGLVVATLGFAVGARTINDNSFLTHLATGRLILRSGAVPSADPYSLLSAGEPWIVQSWLASVIYAAAEAGPGVWVVRLVNGACGMAVTLGLWSLTAPARQLVTRVGLTSAAVLTGTALWAPRPLLFGLVGMVLALQVVQGLRSAWWLVPVFTVWVNTHGSFLLGLVMIGAVGVGAALDQRRWPAIETRAGLLAGAGCLVGALGPVGWRLLWFPFHLLGRGDGLERVAEWGPPQFRSLHEYVFLGLMVTIVVAAARGARWRPLLPAVVFMVGGLMAVRNLGVASLVIVAFVAPSLAGLGGTIDGAARGRWAVAVSTVALAALVAAGTVVAATPALDLERYPEAEVDWLDARALVAEPGVTMAHRDIVGNYLTLRYGDRARVFVDDRFDFHPPDVLTDHTDLLFGGDLAGVLERRQVDVVLWTIESPLGRWIERDGDWDVVFRGDTWFVACRRSSDVYQRCR